MSILDGMISSEADLKKALEFAIPFTDEFIKTTKLTKKQKSVIDQMKEGIPLATIFDISKEEREALYTHGCRLMQAGDFIHAKAVLTKLYELYPLDARVIYALASIFQIENNFGAAGKLYVYFLALDATNADGYLRLGECFLGAKEYTEALGTFRTALKISEKHGSERTTAHAKKMIELVGDRLAPAN